MRKRKFKKISFKFFTFILLALFSLSTIFVSVSASGIEYGEEDTIFTFDLNRDYLNFIDSYLPNDFNYYFTLPITFEIGNSNIECYNLSVRIVNGSVSVISYEGLSNIGSPTIYYFVENGVWTDEQVDTDVAFAQGIKISQTYINDLYSFNFQYHTIRTWENRLNRYYQYLAINNLLNIKLNSFRFKNNLEEVAKQNDSILYNISQVYINQVEFENYKIVGFTIGRTILNDDEEFLNIPVSKISFMTNNEKYNELRLAFDFDNNEIYDYAMHYNNFMPYGKDISSLWVNNNYKYLTLYNSIGIMDYLNLSIYGDFNVSQFWVDPDTDSTFNDLFTGIANVPIIVLSNLLSFSVFGWTAFAVLTGIITLLVIIWIIRKLTH